MNWTCRYDVSGVPGNRIEKVIKVDWAHLIHDKSILDSPNYLRQNGRPVIALWGSSFCFFPKTMLPELHQSLTCHV